MRILHIDEQTGWRGGEQQASYLIRGLLERGYACAIAGRPGSPFVTADHGGNVLARFEAPFRGEIDLWSAYRLARAVRRLEIDILHAHTSHALSYACLARTLANRGRVVASRRVDFPPRSNWFSRWKYAQADRVVAISECIAEVMRAFGVPESALTVVHSGIDPTRMNVPALPRAELGIPEEVPLIGNTAALVGHKDQETLLSAMVHVLETMPDAHLVIAGEGPLRADLENQIEDLQIQHSVHLLGFRKDVPRLMRALDVFVMSSKEEGLGTSVLDAMAAGVPVAATAAGGVPEMIEHEKTGLLSPVADAKSLASNILRLIREIDLRQSVIAGASVRLQAHFIVDRMVDGNVATYRAVLGDLRSSREKGS